MNKHILDPSAVGIFDVIVRERLKLRRECLGDNVADKDFECEACGAMLCVR